MLAIVTFYLVVALCTSILLMFVGLRSRGRRRPLSRLEEQGSDAVVAPVQPGTPPPTDVHAALSEVIARVMQSLTDAGLTLDVAIPSGLPVREAPERTVGLMESMVRVMLLRAQERLLISASEQGSLIMVRMTNDAPWPDLAAFRAALQDLPDQAMQCGAMLTTEVLPGQGCRLVVGLARYEAVADSAATQDSPVRPADMHRADRGPAALAEPRASSASTASPAR